MTASAVILTWEHPAELWLEDVRRADVFTWFTDSAGETLLARDVPWGCYEDLETGDKVTKYVVRYYDHYDRVVGQLFDDRIRRYEKPGNICRINFAYTQSDGAPWSNRVIEIESTNGSLGSFSRKLATNCKGEALLFLMPGAQVTIRLEGDRDAYDVAVPNEREITGDQLIANGSPAAMDPRQVIGGSMHA
jgi:hypothetical protein